MAGKGGGKRGKNNILYVKPEDPSFLKQMKMDAGFKEGDTIETKRQRLEDGLDDDDDFNESDEEKPTIVVLKKGDLTKEEADKIEKENAEKKADLTERIIFKVKSKDQPAEDSVAPKPKEKSRKSKPSKSILSFNDEDEDEESF